MNINNKTEIKRGANMAEPIRQSALTYDGMSMEITPTITGGDIVFMDGSDVTEAKLNRIGAIADFVTKIEGLLGITFAGATPAEIAQNAIDEMRENIFICFQGSEEPNNSYLPVKDNFVKLRDCVMTMKLKDLSEAQFAQVTAGQCLTIDSNGFIGTSKVTADAGHPYMDGLGAFATRIKGAIVIGKKTDFEGAYLIDIQC